jgi:hypothetical protein
MGIKATNLFGWEHEPAQERQSTFGSTTFGTAIAGRSLGLAGEESPFKRPLTPQDWQARREPLRPVDTVLTPLAQAWVQQLPAPTRPVQLCEHYPRIANRISLCWPDKVLTAQVFESLFSSKRGGRRGFPKAIAEELNALKKYSSTRRMST